MKSYGGVEIMLLAFLIITVYGGVLLASCPGCFTPKVKTSHCPLSRREDGPQSQSGCFREEGSHLPLAEIKLIA
jgi:hypothetical protein